MLTSRSVAGFSVTSSPSMKICPSLAISSPAIRRKVVVFPHPDGPNRVTSVPRWMSKVTLLTAVTGP